MILRSYFQENADGLEAVLFVSRQVMALYLMFTMLWTGTFLHDWGGPALEKLLTCANSRFAQLQMHHLPAHQVIDADCHLRTIAPDSPSVLESASKADFWLPSCPCPSHTHSPWIASGSTKLFETLSISFWTLAFMFFSWLAENSKSIVFLLWRLLLMWRPYSSRLYLTKRALLI